MNFTRLPFLTKTPEVEGWQVKANCSSATDIQITLPRPQFLCLQSGTEQRQQSLREHEANCFKGHTSCSDGA